MSFFGYVIFVSKRYKFPNKEIEGVETEHFEMVFTKLIMTTLCQKNIVSTSTGLRGQIASPCVGFVSKRYEVANREVRGQIKSFLEIFDLLEYLAFLMSGYIWNVKFP